MDVLRLFPSYVNELSFTVWENLVGNLSILDRLLSYTDCYEDFKKFAAKLFAPTAVRLGWDPKDTDCELKFTLVTSLVHCLSFLSPQLLSIPCSGVL